MGDVPIRIWISNEFDDPDKDRMPGRSDGSIVYGNGSYDFETETVFPPRLSAIGKVLLGLLAAIFLVFLSAGFILLASALPRTPKQSPVLHTPSHSYFNVDPIFREYYEALGGEAVLGPVVSQMIEEGDLRCQFTENVKMCANLDFVSVDRFTLAPLARAMGFSGPPGYYTYGGPQYIVDGYTIYSEFVPLYESLFGGRFAGRPLSEVIHNQEYGRLEQYFENVIIAIEDDAQPGSAHLLTLGYATCGPACDPPPGMGSAIVAPVDPPSPFIPYLREINALQIIGRPLTRTFESHDGYRMQIYENAVVCEPLEDNPEQQLCPIARELGMTAQFPGPKVHGLDRGLVFYPVEGGLGYHVPTDFDLFIKNHGGRKAAGLPIAEVLEYEGGIIRQCFDNYCLDFNEFAPPGQRANMSPLGWMFLEKRLYEGVLDPDVISQVQPQDDSLDAVMMVAEANEQVKHQEPQTIYLAVLDKNTGEPAAGVTATLAIRFPNGTQPAFPMPETTAEGYTSFQIPIVQGLSTGDMISYEVCLDNSGQDFPDCATGAYLIWDE